VSTPPVYGLIPQHNIPGSKFITSRISALAARQTRAGFGVFACPQECNTQTDGRDNNLVLKHMYPMPIQILGFGII
jgi:hypothetical protein